jgi:glutamate synthase (NADPH/NADH) small chain
LSRRVYEKVPGSNFELEADLVLLAIGFWGPERQLLDKLGVGVTERGNVAYDDRWATNVPGVFACGDATRGASLIVWAIAEGRAAAAAVDSYLVGETLLPAVL